MRGKIYFTKYTLCNGKVSKSYDIGVICCDESESDDENEPQIADATPNLLHSSLKMLTCAHSKAIKEVSRVFSRGD